MVMTSENYVTNVMRTDTPITPELMDRLQDPRTVRLLHCAMGLCTEAGEFMDILKRHIFYGAPVDKINAAEELGDCSWYIGNGVHALEITFEQMLTMNIKKLRARFPDRFDEDLATSRDLDTERNVLETSHANNR
jgi:NTP pyrophosphatase (non-canonical NTP hydrolase)